MAASDRRLVRSKSGLKIVSIADEVASPFNIPEPVWVPDNECPECMQCRSRFAFTKRRHHCRRCGKCFCKQCCDKQLPLPRMCFVDPVRQCDECANTTNKENDFFGRHMKTLAAGGYFTLSGTMFPVTGTTPLYFCKMSQNQRHLQFDGEENMESVDSIELEHVEGVQIQTSGTDMQGNTVATGISVRFKDSHGEMQDMRLTATDAASHRRQAMAWIASMQRAMKMLYDSRNNRS